MKPVQVGIIGFGTVGSGVVQLFQDRPELLAQRLGAPLVLKKVVDIDLTRPRPVALEGTLLSDRARDILDDPDIEVVVELIGGLEEARQLVMGAIARGKHVVTANKALLALHGNDIFAVAAARGVEVAFEAAVGGGIPVIHTLRVGLAANRIQELLGILNGTTNYILTLMSDQGVSFAQALAEAQVQGYAEADPTLDVDGVDAAHKLAILMGLAYGVRLNLGGITVEGIRGLDPLDLQFAREFGYVIKLLAITRDDGDALEARVHPTLIPRDHMLANVKGAFNALHLVGDAVGPLLLYGQGAGMLPTASAVMSDLMELARNLRLGGKNRVPPLGAVTGLERERPLKPMADLVTNYYMRFAALDRPGVLSQISGILGKHHISIAAVIQKGREVKGAVPIVMITHEAREANVNQALVEMDHLTVVSPPTIRYRIEDPHLHAAQI